MRQSEVFGSWLDLQTKVDNLLSHLGDNNHVPKMGFHHIWFLVDWSFLLLLAELLDQGHRLTLKTSGKFTPNSAGEKLHQPFIVHVQKLIQVNPTVSELTESPLLLQLSSFIGHGDQRLSLVEVNQAILAWSF